MVDESKLPGEPVNYMPCIKVQRIDFHYLVVDNIKTRNMVLFNANPIAATFDTVNITAIQGL